MQRHYPGENKPFGWSYHWTHAPATGFRFGIWGGTLHIPNERFREWFIRIPLVGKAITLTHRAT